MEFTIYHNPRCRKSREALQYLEEKAAEYQTVKYLEDLFDKKTLGDVLKKIKLNPSDIVRKNETLWKKEYASQYLTCLLYTSPSPRDRQKSRMPSSA